jgi:pimeloyl-ACP methyl ester carboxylesterase
VSIESIESIELGAGEFTYEGLAAGPEDGRLVLLLHGFPQMPAMWRAQLNALGEAGYRAVAPAQRGYASGARPDDVAAYHVDHLVADVIAFGDALGAERFDLVGHDWGAIVGWHVAVRHAKRLRSWTAVSVPHHGAFTSSRVAGSDQKQRSSYIDLFREPGGKAEALLLENDGQRLQALLQFEGADQAAIAENVRAFLEPGRMTGALNYYRAMERPTLGAAGDKVSVPTLFVWSDNDLAISREAAEGCEQYVSGPFRFETLTGVSHWIPEHAPDDLNRLLLDHLAATP